MTGRHIGWLEAADLQAAANYRKFVADAERPRQCRRRWDLDSFCLPEEHAEVQLWRRWRLAVRAGRAGPRVAEGQTTAGVFLYDAEHLQLFREDFPGVFSRGWPPDMRQFEDVCPEECVAHLPIRGQQSVLYHRLARARRMQKYNIVNPQEQYKDLNMSLTWQGAQASGCLVSSARPFLINRARDLTGVEALSLQGFHIPDLMQLGLDWSVPEQLCAAGNAMNGFTLSSIMLGMLAASPWCRLQEIALDDVRKAVNVTLPPAAPETMMGASSGDEEEEEEGASSGDVMEGASSGDEGFGHFAAMFS